jgi:hypothetical protein
MIHLVIADRITVSTKISKDLSGFQKLKQAFIYI